MEIKKFDIWLLDFDPSVGSEIPKTRPAIVLSNDFFNLSSGTIFVIPLTSTEPKTSPHPFQIKIEKSKKTGLSLDSYANATQFRSVSKLRFVKKIGEIEKNLEETFVKSLLFILDFDFLDLKYLK